MPIAIANPRFQDLDDGPGAFTVADHFKFPRYNHTTGHLEMVAGAELITLGDLSDVDTTGAVSGNALVYDGADWVPGAAGVTQAYVDAADALRALKTGDTFTGALTVNMPSAAPPIVLGANGHGQKVIGLNADLLDGLEGAAFALSGHTHGAASVALDDLTDVAISAPSTGHVLRYNGSSWVNAQLAYTDLSGAPVLTDYAYKPGIAGGQTIIGGTGAGDDLTLRGSSHGTPGDVIVTNGRIMLPDGGTGGLGFSGSAAFIQTSGAGGYLYIYSGTQTHLLGLTVAQTLYATSLSISNAVGINAGVDPDFGALHVKPLTSGRPVIRASAVTGQAGDLYQGYDETPALVWRINKVGFFMTRKVAAPADADVATSEMALWFDNTNGAGKLMIKAKTADGTVVTGSLALA